MHPVVRFLSYHNAVPIGIALVFMGSASAFAATNPDVVFSKTQKVIAVDNSFIANTNLSNFSPRATISRVTEDTDNYYVEYIFSTIGLSDSVWRTVDYLRTMTIERSSLGAHDDLGLYVTKELGQLISHEKEYLSEVQTQARAQLSTKIVSTEYGGLVGKFLDATTETLPGYTPVIEPEKENTQPLANTASVSSPVASNTVTTPSVPQNNGDLQVLGKNPARIELNRSFIDLGVFIANQHYANFGIRVNLDGVDVPDISIDTSKVATHTIIYTVTDQEGVSVTASRSVEVFDPNPVAILPAENASSTPSTSTSTSL